MCLQAALRASPRQNNLIDTLIRRNCRATSAKNEGGSLIVQRSQSGKSFRIVESYLTERQCYSPGSLCQGQQTISCCPLMMWSRKVVRFLKRKIAIRLVTSRISDTNRVMVNEKKLKSQHCLRRIASRSKHPVRLNLFLPMPCFSLL